MSVHVQGRTRIVVLAALAVTAAVIMTVAVGVAKAATADGAAVVPGQLIVGFSDSASSADQRAAVEDADARIVQRLPSTHSAVVSTETPRAAAGELAGLSAVDYVEPNYVVSASRIPNDDAFTEQWGLRNLGQMDGRAGADIGATAAWDVATGGGVTVAVIDTGVDYTHPDLQANIWHNGGDPVNGIDDDADGFVDDSHGADFVNADSDPRDDAGHGTHVAGIIGAQGNNGFGTSGVNWNSSVMALKFLDQNGEGNTADAASAIDYAVDHGARVINASWGGPAFSQTLYDAVRRAAAKGVVFVAASGNEGNNSDNAPDYPAAFDLPNVISVAASDRNDHLLPYSNYGRQSVDLAAPGDDIYSTVPTSVDPTGYANFSGTSMAAPFVAGTVALYLSRAPEASGDQARNAVLQSSTQSASFAGRTVTGGRLNAAAALGVAPQPSSNADRTPPSAFKLLKPRNHYATARRALKFKWQRSRDAGGIKRYKLFVDGRKVRTLEDVDGVGGKDPSTHTFVKLGSGKHSWYVKAYDYAGNVRHSRVAGGRTARSSRLLYVGKRYTR